MSQLNLHLPTGIAPEEATRLLCMKLFEVGRLSLGKAAELAGYSKPAFMELLGKEGIPVYNYSGEDLEQELRDLEALSEADPQDVASS